MRTVVVGVVVLMAAVTSLSVAETVGPPIHSNVFGDAHRIVLTTASPDFAADFSTYDAFTADLYAITGNGDPYQNPDVGWTNEGYETLGPGVVKFGTKWSWPWGFVVYKFATEPGYVTSGGTIQAHVFFQGTANMEGAYYYIGVNSSFVPTADLAYFNNADFAKADCISTQGWGQYFRTLTLTIPANLAEFYVVFGKEYHAGYYGAASTDAISVSATLVPVSMQGTVIREGYAADNSTVGLTFEFVPTGSGSTITRQVFLNADGTFNLGLGTIPAGTYALAVKSEGSLKADAGTVTISNASVVLAQPIVLKGADVNGDNRVSFEDFSILQNGYGQSGAGANPLAAAATGGCGGLGVLVMSILGLAGLSLRVKD